MVLCAQKHKAIDIKRQINICHYTAGRLTSIQQPKGWPSNTSLRLRNRRRRFCEFTAPCATIATWIKEDDQRPVGL